MWDAQVSKFPCYICHTSHYDDATGLVVQCQKCNNAWHQECHPLKIRLEDALSDSWECGVCSGQVEDVCCHCHGDWEDPDHDNLLYFCEGTSGRLWHTKCHNPPIELVGKHAIWRCTECSIQQAQEEEEAVAVHQPAIPKRSRACKITQKGASDARRVRVHGIAVPEMRISVPATTRLYNKARGMRITCMLAATKQRQPPRKGCPVMSQRQPNCSTNVSFATDSKLENS